MSELAATYQARTGIQIILEGGGATRGIRDTASKKVHMGGTCRAQLRGNLEEIRARLTPVAWDALVVIVHPSNPVQDISISQLQQIFDGQITNWQALGGADQPIKLFTRDGKISGVGHALRELVFADPDREFVGSSQSFPSSGPLEQGVESDALAIAVTGIASAQKRAVKILKLEGKEANFDTIKSGEYLLYRPLYLASNPANPRYREVKRFIDFAHSSRGKSIIRNQGVVPYLDGIHLVRNQRTQLRDSYRKMRDRWLEQRRQQLGR